jgi:3-deoxy-D-manno-octulosonic-acid transferase
VVFANARISDRAFARYQRWKSLVLEFYAEALAHAHLFLAQTQLDAERLRAMGAPRERVEVIGNLKFDGEPPSLGAFGAWLREQAVAEERWPLLMAGSVVAQEEDAVLAAYDIVQRRWRRALLVLAPRKPDRFDAAGELIEAAGWRLARRSRMDLAAPLEENVDVILLDSIGELAGLYSIADAVFVGGSLVAAGGHNILEPAWFARPPVFGNSMENFREMADQFLTAHAAVEVSNGPMLGKVWTQLIEDPARREAMGKAAQKVCERNRGATGRCLDRIAGLLEPAGRPK